MALPEKLIALVLAILIVQPGCCCQPPEAEEAAETACCHRLDPPADDHCPDCPEPNCPANAKKAPPAGHLCLPKAGDTLLATLDLAPWQHFTEILPSGVSLKSQPAHPPAMDHTGPSISVAYCVYRL